MSTSRESRVRSLLKGITWRILGTLDTTVLSYFFIGDVKVAVAIGGTEVLTKLVQYYFHERAWLMLPPGSIRKTYKKLGFGKKN